MTTLSDRDILRAIEDGELQIDPFSEDSLSASGYDLRAGEAYSIPKGGMALIYTMERVELGPGLCGQLFIRSSFAREGALGSFALVDPGFRGQLTLVYHNLGSTDMAIAKGERIAQLVLSRLETRAKKPYSGRYQDSAGTVVSRRHF